MTQCLRVLLIAALTSAVVGYEADSTTTTTTPAVKYYNEVVESLPSLKGKCVAFTGTNAGIGYWAAVGAARKSPSCLIMLNRPGSKSEKVQEELAKSYPDVAIYTVDCDLSDFDMVRQAAESANKIAAKFGGIDAFGMNAGVMNQDDVRTGDGMDITMQVNHLSQFLLTKLLMPSFQAAAGARGEVRIATQSSAARGSFEGLTAGVVEEKYYLKSTAGTLGGNGTLASLQRYHQTKMANVAFMMAMNTKLRAAKEYSNIKAMTAAPGVSKGTDLSVPTILKPLLKLALSAPDGATPLLTAMFKEGVQSGDGYEPAYVINGPPYKFISEGVAVPESLYRKSFGLNDPGLCTKDVQDLVWSASEDGLGEKFVIGPTSETVIV